MYLCKHLRKILHVCGAQNLYFAVMKKIYPENVDAEQEFGPLPGPGGGPR